MSVDVMPARATRWDRLGRHLRGELVTPSDPRYERARVGYWAQFDHVRPGAVAYCETPADVAACLVFCQDADVPAVPRSGGHSLGGYSTTEGLVVDVSRMSRVRTERTGDAVTAVVGAGARQVDALLALWDDGVVVPGGMCPTVSLGGFVSGGGFGWLTRKHGMASDHVLAAEVVLADGRVVRCSESAEPELFWALRGAGGGNFGVITEYEMRVRRVPRLVAFHLRWPGDAAADVIAAWQRWVVDGPDELGTGLTVTASGGEPGTVDVTGG